MQRAFAQNFSEDRNFAKSSHASENRGEKHENFAKRIRQNAGNGGQGGIRTRTFTKSNRR